MNGPVLSVSGMVVRYGGVVAVRELSLTVGRGELVSLIGPNGAGKTSALDAVSGYAPAGGTVLLDGVDIGGWAPHRRTRAGMARTFQQLELFDDLTVGENLAVAARARRGLRAVGAANLDPLQVFGLHDVADICPLDLPQGTRRLVAMARALATDPQVLLLDEPAAGLSSGESMRLGQTLRRLADQGLAVLLIEHDVPLVLSVSDRVVVLDAGVPIATGTPGRVQRDPAVLAAYLGDPVS